METHQESAGLVSCSPRAHAVTRDVRAHRVVRSQQSIRRQQCSEPASAWAYNTDLLRCVLIRARNNWKSSMSSTRRACHHDDGGSR
ncbi:hypothetical protein U9M48_017665 [Paspalum notatum var. saurae]|uniref:Uncharacterized protein n=1 Tax=Paspalum notatum var. saurae TaxID=547442 RepID=A0AAQ3TBE4_PASNO